MTKNDFFNGLKENLNGLSKYQIKDIISDFEEHFESGISEGKTEAQICEALGDPKDIASQFIKKGEIKNTKISTKVFTILGLLGLNIIFVIWVYVAFIIVLASFWFTSLVTVASGIGTTMAAALYPFSKTFIDFGFHPVPAVISGLIILVIGLLFVNFNICLTRIAIRTNSKYINWNLKVMRGE